ncbi:Uncharacterized protein Rs2_07936 [Raphanus sativus]|nr:Uncharacterized protein Rs2_07936 [Raphanus sativus]
MDRRQEIKWVRSSAVSLITVFTQYRVEKLQKKRGKRKQCSDNSKFRLPRFVTPRQKLHRRDGHTSLPLDSLETACENPEKPEQSGGANAKRLGGGKRTQAKEWWPPPTAI